MSPPALRRRRNRNPGFDINAQRRAEIVRHARYVGAADTDDLSRWLTAWIRHNPNSKDQVGAVIEAARRMGRADMTPADARAIIDEARELPPRPKADKLADWLGVTYTVRQRLRFRTIGSVNVKKRARTVLRKRARRLAQAARRHAAGARPQSQSLTRTKPWEAMNMSRATWYRRRTNSELRRETDSWPITLNLYATDSSQGNSSAAVAAKEEGGLPSSQTASTLAVYGYESLPVELRLLALGLPMSENLARAA
jgi:hypothetical protein